MDARSQQAEMSVNQRSVLSPGFQTLEPKRAAVTSPPSPFRRVFGPRFTAHIASRGGTGFGVTSARAGLVPILMPPRPGASVRRTDPAILLSPAFLLRGHQPRHMLSDYTLVSLSNPSKSPRCDETAEGLPPLSKATAGARYIVAAMLYPKRGKALHSQRILQIEPHSAAGGDTCEFKSDVVHPWSLRASSSTIERTIPPILTRARNDGRSEGIGPGVPACL